MKPHVICHMIISLGGRIHPSRWTESPDGTRKDWTSVYEEVHGELEGDAWLVGRVTMAEMSKAPPHPPASHADVTRPHHVARRDAETYAIAFDRSGKLHFAKGDVGGDHGALGITGLLEVGEASGLAGKARLRFTSCQARAHGVVHLRYSVEAT